MAPVIWGLNLKEITWSKFGNQNMWSNRYHLRRTKFIIYQLAMIFCVVSESLGTAAMTDYLDQSEYIHQLDNNALEYNNDYVGIASYNIFAGVFVAFVFGSAFFFDLIWPERHESPGVRLAWRTCSILAILFEGGAAFALTIITARGAASVSGVGTARAIDLLRQAKYSPLVYRENHRAIAAIVFIWPGWLFVTASTVLLWLSMGNEDRHGTTLAAHIRGDKAGVESVPGSHGDETHILEKPTTSAAPTVVGGGHRQMEKSEPGFEADTTAAIDGIRRTPKETSELDPAAGRADNMLN